MYMMKYLLHLLLVICSLSATAQRVRPFAGFSLYLDNEFKNSGYGGVNAGAEFKVKTYFRPEIETSFLLGNLQNKTLKDNLGNATDLIVSRVSSVNFSFCPKICLGGKEQENSFLSIRPKYNFSRIQASGSHFVINQSNPLTSVEQKDQYDEWRHSLGIGIGIDIYVSDKNSSSVAFILYYQGIDMGKALSELKFSTSNYSTKDVIGLGITYYIGAKNKE